MFTKICGGVYIIPASIIVPYTGRSDEGLVDNICKENPNCKKVSAINFDIQDYFFKDYVLIVGDRIEMLDVASQAFRAGIPIIHYYAGIKATHVALDELVRPVITILSDIQICESEETFYNVLELCKAIGKEHNAYVGKPNHLDFLEIDESEVPDREYNLILYNPVTMGGSEILNIILEPNNDIRYMENQPRDKYLGLLKNCNIFFTNSSSGKYEAPYFLEEKQIVHIGQRNKERSEIKYEDRHVRNSTDSKT